MIKHVRVLMLMHFFCAQCAPEHNATKATISELKTVLKKEMKRLTIYQAQATTFLQEHPNETSELKDRIAKRMASLQKLLQGTENYQEHSYQLSKQAEQLIEHYIPGHSDSMTLLIGNELQHILHEEANTLFDVIAHHTTTLDAGCFTDIAIQSVHAGQCYNRHGYVIEALHKIDVGWHLVQMAHDAEKNKFRDR